MTVIFNVALTVYEVGMLLTRSSRRPESLSECASRCKNQNDLAFVAIFGAASVQPTDANWSHGCQSSNQAEAWVEENHEDLD